MKTYNIIKSESFKEGVKKLRKEHKKDTLIKLSKIINELVEGKITKQYHNHPSTNIKGRVYDLHVEDNVVLIYRFLGGAIVLSLELLDLIDHDTLMSNNYIKKLNKKLKEDIDIYETKNNSKVEQIDNLIEDIYNLRKEGMEEDGEYSIKNLIFKEFRNLGYLDNLKDLRKKEISKELSLEQLNK